jgi:acyl transferase domain-containing protein
LAAVFGADRAPDRPLVIGSLKTNVGHLEAAAGIAGLIKAVLALQHDTIPAHLHFREMNPHIDWGQLPVEIPVSARPRPRGAKRRVAGVSSFGFSGTNAHVVLEEAPALEVEGTAHANVTPASMTQTDATPRTHVLALSARTPAALDQVIARYRDALERSDATLADICHTANVRRTHLPERAAFLASTREAMRDALAAPPIARGTAEGTPSVAFVFPGQGAQWPGMGRELYDTEPVFRDALDACADILATRLERPLLDVLFDDDRTALDQTQYTQPAIFAIEWALAQLWKSWGIEPTVVFGHSVGEYAMLAVAGVWTLEDGLTLIAERGRLTQALDSGWGMTAVQCARSEVDRALADVAAFVSVAAINGPDSFVLSGRDAELRQAEDQLRAIGVRVTRLAISHGFHSAQMDDVAVEFSRIVARVPMQESRYTIVSSVTGQPVTLAELRQPEYWRRQVRDSVQFQAAMDVLASLRSELIVEIGPAPVLIGMGRLGIGERPVWVPSLR